jgi:GNAT superfamily N-acetyltransferase
MEPSESLASHHLCGAAVEPWLENLGRLRIAVFREFPYLYEGSLDYERDYLRTYVRSSRSLVVLLSDASGSAVGASTCLPLCDEGPEFQEPFLRMGRSVAEICYFGESILLPRFRGLGYGKEFFRFREAHARSLGLTWAAFCSVNRSLDHPLRPATYRPLDEFWAAQGYTRHPELQATFVWKEIGEDHESPKSLTFWLKELKRDA